MGTAIHAVLIQATQDIISYVRTLETSFSEQEWVWIIKVIKLEPEILICLPLVPKLIKNQSANIWKLFEFFDFVM